jgi:hypothetical protein
MKRLLQENERARISEVIYSPGIPRASYVRETDQIVVFLDDCAFDRHADGQTHRRDRKSGEVLWHPKGEQAPVLINRGSKPFRTLLIELL